MNEYLDEELKSVVLREGSPTRREIMEVFVYGYFSHANLDKRKKFDKWMEMTMVSDFIEFELIIIVISDRSNRIALGTPDLIYKICPLVPGQTHGESMEEHGK